MSLDRNRLQKVRELANGGLQAQCPACAETGQDRKGEHLRIAADGKFGCCVFPGDRKHRSRIFGLVGEHSPKTIKVRVSAAKSAEPLQLDLLGRLGRVFSTPTEAQVSDCVNSGTLGTPIYSLREGEKENSIRELIDNRTGVPSVPTEDRSPICRQSETSVPSVPAENQERDERDSSDEGDAKNLPYLTPSGDLRIPFDSPERYHWWKPPHDQRLRVREILAEIRERILAEGHPY